MHGRARVRERQRNKEKAKRSRDTERGSERGRDTERKRSWETEIGRERDAGPSGCQCHALDPASCLCSSLITCQIDGATSAALTAPQAAWLLLLHKWSRWHFCHFYKSQWRQREREINCGMWGRRLSCSRSIVSDWGEALVKDIGRQCSISELSSMPVCTNPQQSHLSIAR